MWGFTPFLNWADILTVERAIVVLVKLGGNCERVSRRAPFFPHVLADILGCGWNFLKIPSMADLLGCAQWGTPLISIFGPWRGFPKAETTLKLPFFTLRLVLERSQSSNSGSKFDILGPKVA